MKTISTVLYALQVLLSAYSTGQEFECVSLDNCACDRSGRIYKIVCPKDHRLETHDIETELSPRNDLTFNCNDSENMVNFGWLTGLQFGEIKKLSFSSCRLTNISLTNLMSDLRIRGITTLKVWYATDSENVFDTKFIKGVVNLTHLELKNAGIKELPHDFLNGMIQVTNLDLLGNHLQLLPKPLSSVPNLLRLELGQNNLQYITGGVFKDLKKLKLLNLWGNHLRNIDQEAFNGLSNLTSLDLSSNGITSLPSMIFKDLRKLETLSLNNNNFSTYPQDIFSGLTSLKEINLHNNNNESFTIPRSLLANLTSLTRVQINNCNISLLPEDIFWRSKNISLLNLSYNRLHSLPEQIFKDSSNMTELNLGHNKLKSLPSKIFSSLEKLQTLELGYNRLTNITRSLFESLPELITLHLENNALKELSPDAFLYNLKLKKLYMKNNYLTLTKNKYLDYYESSSPLQYCKNLEVVELANNSISEIFSDWRLIHRHLKTLNLSYNKIANIEISDLHFFSDSLVIDLSYNNISHINLRTAELVVQGQEEPFPENRNVKVELQGNPLHCDCSIYLMLKYWEKRFNPEVFKLVNLQSTNLRCASPIEKAGMMVTNLHSRTLTCPWKTSNVNAECPKSCSCSLRMEDRILLIDCSQRGLLYVPAVLPQADYSFNIIELNLTHNSIEHLPLKMSNSYENVSKLFLSYNNLTTLNEDMIPPKVKELHLDHNKFAHLNVTVLEYLRNRTNVTLHSNPWECNCDALDFLNFLQNNFKQVEEFNKITCKDGRPLSRLTTKDICPIVNSSVIAVSVVIAAIGIIVGVLAALYYRYQSEIKVWLYARNMCLWFVTEEELDRGKLYDAFVSYSHKDEDFIVNKLVPGLENGPSSFKLCLHYRDWIAGEWIPNQIARSVEESRRTLVVLSPNFIESVWGRMEFRTAHSQALSEGRARVIVLLYGDIGPTEDLDPELRAYLSMNTYVKWGDPWFWEKLRYALPHIPKTSKTIHFNQRNVSYDNPLEDKLELINPSTPPAVTTPPAEMNVNPMELNRFVGNGHVRMTVETNGHINGVIKSV